MLSAFFLVVTGLGNRTGRTAVNAFATSPISEKEAIGPVVGIWAWCWFNGYLGHHRSHPHGFALCGNEPVAETKSAQTSGMGGMAFRSGRSIRKPFRLDDGPVGNQHRSDCRMTDIFQTFDHVVTQGHVERLSVNSDHSPFLGWICPGPAVRLADHLPLGQYP